MSSYSELFKPIQVGSYRLKNRFTMGPVTTGLEGDSKVDNEWVDFYQKRCLTKGPGLFTLQYGAISVSGKRLINQPVLDNAFYNTAFRLTSFARASGTEILLQLNHYGLDGAHFGAVSATGLFNQETRYSTHTIPTILIDHFINQYVQQAHNAIHKGGFTGVEINASRQTLPNTFISPILNKRQDYWGGEGRFEFVYQIIKRIRQKIGPQPIISFRLCIMDLVPYGSSWEDLTTFTKNLSQLGVDLFTFDIGLSTPSIPINTELTPPGVWYPFIEELASQCETPFMLSSSEGTLDDIHHSLQHYPNALVELDHSLVADFEWGNKVFYGKEDTITPCARCGSHCLTKKMNGEDIPLCCVSNPYALFPFSSHEVNLPILSNLKLLIIGAGPAGMAASEYAARLGLQVTLIEERPFLGGLLKIASMVPGKEIYQKLLDQKEQQLLGLGVEVIKGIHATTEWIKNNYPNHSVIITTGCQSAIPDVTGIDSINVLTFEDLFLKKAPIGHRVAILGSNRIAFNTARYVVNTEALTPNEWLKAWGIGDPKIHQAGCQGVIPSIDISDRITYLVTPLELRQLRDYTRVNDLQPDLQWLQMNGLQTVVEATVESIDTSFIRIKYAGDTPSTIYTVDHVVIADELEPKDELLEDIAHQNIIYAVAGSMTDPQSLFGGAVNMQSGIKAVKQVIDKYRNRVRN